MANEKNEKYKQVQFKRRIWRRLNMATGILATRRGGEPVSNGTAIDVMIDSCFPEVPFDPEVEPCHQ